MKKREKPTPKTEGDIEFAPTNGAKLEHKSFDLKSHTPMSVGERNKIPAAEIEKSRSAANLKLGAHSAPTHEPKADIKETETKPEKSLTDYAKNHLVQGGIGSAIPLLKSAGMANEPHVGDFLRDVKDVALMAGEPEKAQEASDLAVMFGSKEEVAERLEAAREAGDQEKTNEMYLLSEHLDFVQKDQEPAPEFLSSGEKENAAAKAITMKQLDKSAGR